MLMPFASHTPLVQCMIVATKALQIICLRAARVCRMPQHSGTRYCAERNLETSALGGKGPPLRCQVMTCRLNNLHVGFFATLSPQQRVTQHK